MSKNSLNRYAGMALMLGLMNMRMMEKGYSGSHDGSIGHGIPNEPKKVIPRGCKEYTIYGITVVALNEKSAFRKIQKIRKRGIK